MREYAKRSAVSQMQDYTQWGIMTDWRYSYLTMMPDYEASVLDSLAKLLRQRGRGQSDLIYRGSRAVFWSTDQQRIMDENQIEEFQELRDCVVAKFPIVSFGKQPSKLGDMYENVKMLVFCQEPWKLLGTQGIAINDKIMYALIKCTYKSPGSLDEPHTEYLILAEKRIGEFLARGNYYVTPGGKKLSMDIKTLILMQGEQLKELTVKNPLVPERGELPIVVFNEITSTYGTGVNAVIPGHDVESLKIAQVYNLEKAGCLDLAGDIIKDFGKTFGGLSAKDEKTNETVIRVLDREGHLFRSFKYQNAAFKNKDTGERIMMLTKDSWFMHVNDRLKMRCLQELAHVKYVPQLNLKTTEETHKDLEELKAKRHRPRP